MFRRKPLPDQIDITGIPVAVRVSARAKRLRIRLIESGFELVVPQRTRQIWIDEFVQKVGPWVVE